MYNYGGLFENGHEKQNLDSIIKMMIYHEISVENQWNFMNLTTENPWIESNLKIDDNYGITILGAHWNLTEIINF